VQLLAHPPSVCLTRPGEAFLLSAETILQMADEANANAQRVAAGEAGNLLEDFFSAPSHIWKQPQSAATAVSDEKTHSIGSRPKRMSDLADSTCPESLLDLLKELIACWQIFCHEVSPGVVQPLLSPSEPLPLFCRW
jgi:hypothetical protein